MPKKFFIGIGGVAGCGKDTFYQITKDILQEEGISVERLSLADHLKEDLRKFIIDKFDIDPTNCTRNEKDKIRPLLVAYAKLKRETSRGRYWIEKVDDYIKTLSITKKTLFMVTDLRFSFYEKDEVYWIQEQKKGIVVHLSRFEEDTDSEGKAIKSTITPANEEERMHDPLVKVRADYKFNFPTIDANDDQFMNNLKPKIKSALNKIKKDHGHFFN
tara:strand:- start:4165 stop:4812 length:648 start_codon:yes stop_codon:yes gene_type:complete